jgi:hypothetical protein
MVQGGQLVGSPSSLDSLAKAHKLPDASMQRKVMGKKQLVVSKESEH